MALQIIKSVCILIALIIYLICGAILHLLITFIKPSLRWKAFSHLTKVFASALRKILSVRVIIDGNADIVASGATLIVSNHLSYLDGIILGSIFPVVYLSKKEIKSWPLVGWMASISGTIFIDRARKDKSPEYLSEILRKMNDNVNVLLFPEGTSTNGENILPFQSVFFAAPLKIRCKILPITIHYAKINNEDASKIERDKIHWYGQMPFSNHLKKMMRLKNIEAYVKLHEIIDTKGFENDTFGRKELAEFTRSIILEGYPKF